MQQPAAARCILDDLDKHLLEEISKSKDLSALAERYYAFLTSAEFENEVVIPELRKVIGGGDVICFEYLKLIWESLSDKVKQHIRFCVVSDLQKTFHQEFLFSTCDFKPLFNQVYSKVLQKFSPLDNFDQIFMNDFVSVISNPEFQIKAKALC